MKLHFFKKIFSNKINPIIFVLITGIINGCATTAIIQEIPLSIQLNLLDSDNKVVKQKKLNRAESRIFMKIFNKSRKIKAGDVYKETLKEGSYDMIIETQKGSFSYLMMNSRNFYQYQNNLYFENASLYKLVRQYLEIK